MICKTQRNGGASFRMSSAGSEGASAAAGRAASLVLVGLCAAMMVASCWEEEPPSENAHSTAAKGPVGADLDAVAAALQTFIQAHGEFGIGRDSLDGERAVPESVAQWGKLGEWILRRESDGFTAVYVLPGSKAVSVDLKKAEHEYKLCTFDVNDWYWHY